MGTEAVAKAAIQGVHVPSYQLSALRAKHPEDSGRKTTIDAAGKEQLVME